VGLFGMPWIETLLFFIGSAAPIIWLVAGAFAFHRLRTTTKLVLQFTMLVASGLFGAWIINRAFPPLPAAHLNSDNPGQAVIYAFLVEAWFLCLTWWLVWLAIAAITARGRRRSSGS
jgi:hypothetical protein